MILPTSDALTNPPGICSTKQVEHFRPMTEREVAFQSTSVQDVIDRRITRAPASIRVSKFGAAPLSHRLWVFKEYALLSVDSKKALMRAGIRERTYGSPFPDLFAIGSKQCMVSMEGRNATFAHLTLDAPAGVPRINLNPDVSGSLLHLGIQFSGAYSPYEEYSFLSVFYVSFGILIDGFNLSEFMDDLIVKYLKDPQIFFKPPV